MDLIPCNTCRRHVRPGDANCPFCAAPLDSPRASLLSRVVTVGIAATTSVTLAACYGGPPVYGVERGPPRWVVDASAPEFIAEFSERARAAQCELSERYGHVVVKCAMPEAVLLLHAGSPHRVLITCDEGSTPANCVAAFDHIRATPPAAGPATIAPPAGNAP